MKTKKAAPTVEQISEGALLKRVNRALARDGRRVKATRPIYHQGNGPHYNSNLGRYYVLDFDSNCAVETDVDLSYLGRRLGVLRAWEYVDDEDRQDLITMMGGLDEQAT